MFTLIKYLTIAIMLSSSAQLAHADSYADLLKDPKRPASDLPYDANRKPEQVIRLANINKGDRVLDVFAGGGYYTELLSSAVGNEGKVISHNNKAYLNYIGDQFTNRHANNRLPNVETLIAEANELNFEDNSLDKIFMILSIHDFYHSSKYWPEIDKSKVLKELYNSLKPGGTLVVVDHIGPDADRTKNSKKLHRVFPPHAMRDIKEAGFKFVTEADFLKNPEDAINISMADKSIRGKTSRFVYTFTK